MGIGRIGIWSQNGMLNLFIITPLMPEVLPLAVILVVTGNSRRAGSLDRQRASVLIP